MAGLDVAAFRCPDRVIPRQHERADAGEVLRLAPLRRLHNGGDHAPISLAPHRHTRSNMLHGDITLWGCNHRSGGYTFVHRPIGVLRNTIRVACYRPPCVAYKPILVVHRFYLGRMRTRKQHRPGPKERLHVVRHVAEPIPYDARNAGLAAAPGERGF